MAFADQDEPAECSDGRIVNRVPRRFIRGFEPEVFLDRGETRLIGVRAFADQKRKMKNMSGPEKRTYGLAPSSCQKSDRPLLVACCGTKSDLSSSEKLIELYQNRRMGQRLFDSLGSKRNKVFHDALAQVFGFRGVSNLSR